MLQGIRRRQRDQGISESLCAGFGRGRNCHHSVSSRCRGVVLSRAVRCVFVWRFPPCILFDLRRFFAGGFSSLLCSGKLYSGLGQKRRSDLPVCFWHPYPDDLSRFHRHRVAAHAVGRGAGRAAYRKAKSIVRQPRSALFSFRFGHTGFGRFGRAYICSKARFACTAAAFINDSQIRR